MLLIPSAIRILCSEVTPNAEESSAFLDVLQPLIITKNVTAEAASVARKMSSARTTRHEQTAERNRDGETDSKSEAEGGGSFVVYFEEVICKNSRPGRL
jgi:hypothetical protein